jgi:hypothetical protein
MQGTKHTLVHGTPIRVLRCSHNLATDNNRQSARRGVVLRGIRV